MAFTGRHWALQSREISEKSSHSVQRILISRPGGRERLRLVEATADVPRDDEYCVAIKAAGVNYADVIIREGYYKAAKGKYPITPGFEYAGTVIAAGSRAEGLSIGDAVFGYTLFGGYSSQINVQANQLRKIPKGWNYQEAAVIPTAYLTAYHALLNVAHVRPGETILVHSAAGGVGLAVLQLASILSCKTIAVVGKESKREPALRYKATEVLIKARQLWAEVDKVAPEGIDVVLDSNGVSTPREGLRRLRPGGRLVVYGFAEILPRGGRPFLPLLVYRALSVPRISLRQLTSTNRAILGLNLAYLVDDVEKATKAFDKIVQFMDAGRIEKFPVTSFPADKVAEAHKLLESGNSVGKLVLEFG